MAMLLLGKKAHMGSSPILGSNSYKSNSIARRGLVPSVLHKDAHFGSIPILATICIFPLTRRVPTLGYAATVAAVL